MPTAQLLFGIYKRALPNANIRVSWSDLPEEMQRAWYAVASSLDRVMEKPYMTQEEQQAQITQLQQQQAIFTKMMAQALQGQWVGADSVEAWLYALDPSIQGTLTLDPPVTEADLPKD